MTELGLHQAEVARRAKTSEATISNWRTNVAKPTHVKATMLLNIADAVEMDARELLLGERSKANSALSVGEAPAPYLSHDVQLETWKVAFQLVAEALDERGLTLPPEKRAEVTLLAHDLIVEGLPRAKVLHFVQAAA